MRVLSGLTGELIAGGPVPQSLEFRAVSRYLLLRALLSRLPPGTVKYGLAVQSARETDDGVELTLEDGSLRRAAALIAADGVHSKLAPLLSLNFAPTEWSGFVAFRGHVTRARVLEHVGERERRKAAGEAAPAGAVVEDPTPGPPNPVRGIGGALLALARRWVPGGHLGAEKAAAALGPLSPEAAAAAAVADVDRALDGLFSPAGDPIFTQIVGPIAGAPGLRMGIVPFARDRIAYFIGEKARFFCHPESSLSQFARST